MTIFLPLQGLQGHVLRLQGVVDRFGRFEQHGRCHHTLCVRNLEHAATGQPIEPDHWWFRLRQSWCEAGVQPGDTVLFTAKVRTCSKGHHNPELRGLSQVRGRERVVGLAGDVRELVILRRAHDDSQQLRDLQEAIHREHLLRQDAEADLARLTMHRDALLQEIVRLRGHVALWRNRCRRPEINPGSASVPPFVPHERRCRGFAALVPAA